MIQIFEYENSPIQFEVIDGQVMANATAMCQAFNKRPNDWLNLAGTKRYMEAITRKNGNSDNQLVISRQGSVENGGGSWIHEKLIIKLSQWLSVDFELWCDEKVSELLKTGTVSLKPKTPAELLLENVQMLVDHERKISELDEKVNQIIEGQTSARNELLLLPVSQEEIPEERTRDKVRKLVNAYSRAKGLAQHDVWNHLYERLYYLYKVSLKSYKKVSKSESLLDIADRTGHMDKIFTIISQKVRSENIQEEYNFI